MAGAEHTFTTAENTAFEMAALRHINSMLLSAGLSLAENFPDLPQPPPLEESSRPDPVRAEIERWLTPEAGGGMQPRTTDSSSPPEPSLAELQRQLNASQRLAFDRIMASVRASIAAEAAAPASAEWAAMAGASAPSHPTTTGCPMQQLPNFFFIDAPGGYGKTFLIKVLLATVRSLGQVALPCASSGIAALLMEGGKTAHTTFSIPVSNLTDDSSCKLSEQTAKAKLIKAAKLIIWDEAPMTDKKAYGAVNRTLQGLMRNNLPFGGKIVVMAGDFRQVLPVVPRGSRASVVNACIKRHALWRDVHILHLWENMYVLQSN